MSATEAATKRSVTVIDYGAGNLHSVEKALEHLGCSVRVITRGEELAGVDRLVLPGVGAFADGMRELASRGLVDAIHAYAATQRPLLGICLGMQFLLDASEEFGDHAGLGLVPGRVRRLPSEPGLKVPHVGWNRIHALSGRDFGGTVLADVAQGAAMYFVHSYGAVPVDDAHVIAVADYGEAAVTAAIARESVMGCQFHPEKSGPGGLAVLARFLSL